jgi:hypothetical protein
VISTSPSPLRRIPKSGARQSLPSRSCVPCAPPSSRIRLSGGIRSILILSLALALAPLALVAAGAAGPAIVGAWDCVATHANGGQTRWSLVIQQNSGKLTATLRSGDGYSLEAIDPKLEDNHFSFSVRVNQTDVIEVLLKVDGDRMDGRFGGTSVGSGLFKAARAGAPNVAGTWTGEWEVDPDGKERAGHYMVLRQDGADITGTVGPSPEQQGQVANGKLAGDKLTFELSLPYGPKFAFAFTVAGETMWGTATLTMNGATRTFKLSAKRAARP